MLDRESLGLFSEVARKLDTGFASLPAFQNQSPGMARLAEVLGATAERLQDNYPYFHPLYAGQMLKPPHPVARLAYALAMWINPNNHALDGGRATSAMEKEAVAEIAGMFGWKKFLGHLCGGGTMANLEALWVAGRLHPGKKILASDQAHYTHGRISGVLQLPFESVPCDARGRMDVNALAKRVGRGDVGTVVATMGTTATGSVDPLPEILALRAKRSEEHTSELQSRLHLVCRLLLEKKKHNHRADPHRRKAVHFASALGRHARLPAPLHRLVVLDALFEWPAALRSLHDDPRRAQQP